MFIILVIYAVEKYPEVPFTEGIFIRGKETQEPMTHLCGFFFCFPLKKKAIHAPNPEDPFEKHSNVKQLWSLRIFLILFLLTHYTEEVGLQKYWRLIWENDELFATWALTILKWTVVFWRVRNLWSWNGVLTQELSNSEFYVWTIKFRSLNFTFKPSFLKFCAVSQLLCFYFNLKL